MAKIEKQFRNYFTFIQKTIDMVFCDRNFALSVGKLISCLTAPSWRCWRELDPNMLRIERTRNRLT